MTGVLSLYRKSGEGFRFPKDVDVSQRRENPLSCQIPDSDLRIHLQFLNVLLWVPAVPIHPKLLGLGVMKTSHRLAQAVTLNIHGRACPQRQWQFQGHRSVQGYKRFVAF